MEDEYCPWAVIEETLYRILIFSANGANLIWCFLSSFFSVAAASRIGP